MSGEHIKSKWKAFAAEQLLSNWNQNLSPEQVFDKIVYSEDENLQETIDDHDILIWDVFSHMEPEDFAWKLERLAIAAQEVEDI